jgi:hypothetical protein
MAVRYSDSARVVLPEPAAAHDAPPWVVPSLNSMKRAKGRFDYPKSKIFTSTKLFTLKQVIKAI